MLTKPVHEYSDKELAEEIARRRMLRSGAGAPPRDERPEPKADPERDVQQALANLELPRGAKWDDIEKRYRELVARYHPDKHRADPDRYRAALDVTSALTRAYHVLYQHRKA